MDPTIHNRTAWNKIARSGKWFSPVSADLISAARRGDWSFRLTACKPIPPEWLGDVSGKRILLLAGGGGYQGPLLAAAGADVCVADISTDQLQIDREVADANDLPLKTLECDMRDLSVLDDGEFDCVVNPCSLNYCPEVRAVWDECHRVLKLGGELIAGMIQPVNYLFDAEAMERGEFYLRHKIPFSMSELDDEEREQLAGADGPLDFGHSLDDLIGGQVDAGFQIVDLFEDRWGGDDLLSQYIDCFVATRAKK